MSSITVTSQVLGSLTVEVDGSDSILALSVLGTAPASLTIELGTPGATGATGATGPGVASGGDTGQVLVKVDATNYNTTWATAYAYQVRNTVRNETGAQLNKGTVVYINGAAGNKVTVAKALATGDATSAQTFAVLAENIPNNQNGLAITSGLLEDLNTSAYSAGTQLYLSPTTAGAFTSTKPSAPDHMVYVGVIERSHANQGSMLVRIQNGYELEELHNVAIAGLANNDLLAYDSSSDLWKNKTYSSLGLLTSSTAASTYYLQTNPAGYITSSALSPYLTSATAASTYLAQASNLSDLTNASTARTNLGLGTAAVEPATKLVPAGGTTGQVLAKSSATSWDLTWTTVTASATWGSITGTLSSQTDLQTALDAKLATSTAASTYQTIAGMSSYLTTSSAASTYLTQSNAASTYQTQSGMSSYLTTSAAASTYQTQSGMSSYLTTSSAASTYAPLASPTFSGSVFIPTIRNLLNDDLVIDSYNDTGAGTHYLHRFTPYDGKFVLASNGGGLTYPDATTQTTAFIDAPSDGSPYVRVNGAWEVLTIQ